jgi:hypothetical protein
MEQIYQKTKGGCMNPIVFITPEAKRKLDSYIRLCNLEISGLGIVTKLGVNLLVEDVFIFSQEVSAAHTDLDSGAIAMFLTELITRGVETKDVNLWWHSHAGGPSFWSHIDEDTIDRLGDSWMLSIVGNKVGDYLARIDVYSPIRVTIDELKVETYVKQEQELDIWIYHEIKRKVKVKKTPKQGRKKLKQLIQEASSALGTDLLNSIRIAT